MLFCDDEIEDFEQLLENIAVETGDSRFERRAGLGEPKNTKSIREEISEYDCVNWTDIVNRKLII